MAARKTKPGGSKPDKHWRNAIILAVHERVAGEGSPQKLRAIAEKVVELAIDGDMAAIKEIGDRLDGKPHQSDDVAVARDVQEMTDAELLEVVEAAQTSISAEDEGMAHRAFIDALGGSHAVADRLGEKLSTVSTWRIRGVPWRHRTALATLARQHRVPLPDGFLHQLPKPALE
ncbi:MAG: hypothetical protein EXQ88_05080 [Alphaproteobacteria bacterium]|nr:hypothetical protein [Alphaproteobacteria bacterium]